MTKFKYLFYGNSNRLRLIWRLPIFVSLLLLIVSPLLLIKHSILQFLGAAVLLILGLYFNSQYLDKRPFSGYGLKFKQLSFLYFSVGTLIGAVSVSFILIIGAASGALSVSTHPTHPEVTSLLLFGFKMVLVAIIEESLYRGYLFTNLHQSLKSSILSNHLALAIAVVVSSVLFGLAHAWNDDASLMSIGLLTINGIVWCVPFIMTNNLGLSIGLHASWNFSQSFWGFTMSGNKAVHFILTIRNTGHPIWTGGEYGPEAGLLGLLGFVVMLLLTVGYLKVRAESTVTNLEGGGN